MLTKHLVFKTKVIPYTEDRYVIDNQYRVTEVATGIVIPTSNDGSLELMILKEQRVVRLDWLVAITYKPVHCAESFILTWTLIYHDEDPNNIHPSNLHWKPPVGGTQCPTSPAGYNVVPGFSTLAVSRDGSVWLRAGDLGTGKRKRRDPDGRLGSIRGSPGNYKQTNGRDYSSNKATTVVHRLMGLAWLEYDNRVNRMTINHKDGIRDHNEIDNLEWTTYSQNNIHAMDMSLRDVRTRVEIRDYLQDGVCVKVYVSLTAAAEWLGINSGTLYHYLKTKKTPQFEYRYCARYVDSGHDWPVLSRKMLERSRLLAYEQGVCVFNNRTGQMAIGDGYSRLSESLGLDRETIRSSVRDGRSWFGEKGDGWHFFRVMYTEQFVEWFMKNYPDNRFAKRMSESIKAKLKVFEASEEMRPRPIGP